MSTYLEQACQYMFEISSENIQILKTHEHNSEIGIIQ